MITDTVQGAQVLTLLTLGLRDFYSKKEIHSVADVKGLKIRVQATPTEDTLFTGLRRAGRPHAVRRRLHVVADRGRRRRRERHQRLPLEQALRGGADHVAVASTRPTTTCIWVSDKAWNSFRTSRRNGCRPRPTRSARPSRRKAIALDHESQTKLEKIGVKFVKSRQIRLHQDRRADPGQDRHGSSGRTRWRSSGWSAP